MTHCEKFQSHKYCSFEDFKDTKNFSYDVITCDVIKQISKNLLRVCNPIRPTLYQNFRLIGTLVQKLWAINCIFWSNSAKMRNIPHEDKELAKKQLDFLKVQLFALR